MWNIPKPTMVSQDIFNICIKGLRGENKRERMKGIIEKINNTESIFDKRATATELHLIDEVNEIAGSSGKVSAKEMEQLYTSHLVRAQSKGRNLYDQIMSSATHGLCPFCGQRPVATLDHCLPKAKHPALAVTPINLIPCCRDCNTNKGKLTPTSAETQFINAYYDNLTRDRWLYARIVETSPAGAVFFVNPPTQWDQITATRVQWHFDTLKLASLYASQAGKELQNIKGTYSRVLKASGATAVKEDLIQLSQSRAKINVNSWERALYEAASESEWYCNGGF